MMPIQLSWHLTRVDSDTTDCSKITISKLFLEDIEDRYNIADLLADDSDDDQATLTASAGMEF